MRQFFPLQQYEILWLVKGVLAQKATGQTDQRKCDRSLITNEGLGILFKVNEPQTVQRHQMPMSSLYTRVLFLPSFLSSHEGLTVCWRQGRADPSARTLSSLSLTSCCSQGQNCCPSEEFSFTAIFCASSAFVFVLMLPSSLRWNCNKSLLLVFLFILPFGHD